MCKFNQLPQEKVVVPEPVKNTSRNNDVTQQAQGSHMNNSWQSRLRIGSAVLTLDAINEWSPAVIKNVSNGAVLVSFDDWSSEWDEWVPLYSERIRQRQVEREAIDHRDDTQSDTSRDSHNLV